MELHSLQNASTGGSADKKGFVEEANLIVGATNNNAAISMSIKKVAEGLIRRAPT